jgi:hypothetical protein
MVLPELVLGFLLVDIGGEEGVHPTPFQKER